MNECPNTKNTKILPADGLLITLMHLRLNLRVEDLSYCFGIRLSTISDIFQRWVNIMFTSLKCLIMWPSQETVHANMPQTLKICIHVLGVLLIAQRSLLSVFIHIRLGQRHFLSTRSTTQ